MNLIPPFQRKFFLLFRFPFYQFIWGRNHLKFLFFSRKLNKKLFKFLDFSWKILFWEFVILFCVFLGWVVCGFYSEREFKGHLQVKHIKIRAKESFKKN
jgi:hypothetical protein